MTLTLLFAAADGRSSQYHAAELRLFLALAAVYHNQATNLPPVQLDCLARAFNVICETLHTLTARIDFPCQADTTTPALHHSSLDPSTPHQRGPP